MKRQRSKGAAWGNREPDSWLGYLLSHRFNPLLHTLDGASGADQLGGMKKFILFLLAVRMIFLGLASLGCLFAIVSGFKDGVEWYWPVGGVLALGLCGFLIGKVWASLKATWKE